MEQITIAAIINEQNTNKNNDSSFSSLNVTAVSQSTPIKYFQTSEACSTPDYKKYSTPSNTGYKPKVNFHSIADLASPCNESGYSSNDSQMQSMNNTPQLASTHRPKVEYEVGKESDKKPIRTTFSDLQKQQLEVFFQRNPYPDPRETEEMSAQLGLGEAVIKVWFQNKRSRDKQRKFSHANRAAMRAALSVNPQSKENVSVQFGVSSSPILSNIQMLTSRICQYQSAMTAWNNQRHFC